MTVIQKKRKYAEEVAGEYGQKYHCDHCQKDITGVVRIRCNQCPDFDLCVECFSTGVEVRDHKNDHAYRVMDILDFPLFDEGWGADEELALIESLENYGLGNWEQAAEHVGTKDKNECRMHYLQTFIYSDTFPLPDMHKKFDFRRSQLGLEAIVKPKPFPKPLRPPTSAPSNHEVAGYMPGRHEFEYELENDAEQMIKDLSFEETDDPEEVELKLAMLDIYNSVLKKRQDRKNFIINSGTLEFKKIQTVDKKRTPDERELYKKCRVFARLMTNEDYQTFMDGLANENKLRHRIQQLQEYRRMGLQTLKEAQEYEKEKIHRAAYRTQLFEQRANSKNTARIRLSYTEEIPTTAGKSLGNQSMISSPYAVDTPPQTTTITTIIRKPLQPLDIRGTEGYDLLLSSEQLLCSNLRMLPRAYLIIKETLIAEFIKRSGKLKKRQARGLVRVDVNKTARIWDFLNDMGWLRLPTV